MPSAPQRLWTLQPSEQLNPSPSHPEFDKGACYHLNFFIFDCSWLDHPRDHKRQEERAAVVIDGAAWGHWLCRRHGLNFETPHRHEGEATQPWRRSQEDGTEDQREKKKKRGAVWGSTTQAKLHSSSGKTPSRKFKTLPIWAALCPQKAELIRTSIFG